MEKIILLLLSVWVVATSCTASLLFYWSPAGALVNESINAHTLATPAAGVSCLTSFCEKKAATGVVSVRPPRPHSRGWRDSLIIGPGEKWVAAVTRHCRQYGSCSYNDVVNMLMGAACCRKHLSRHIQEALLHRIGGAIMGTFGSSIPLPMSVHAAHRISVIVPFRNAEKTLRRALQSIELSCSDLATRIGGNRCLVAAVDDCSSDGSLGVAVDFARHRPHFVVATSSEWIGAGAARNIGVRLLEYGDIFAFLDADDVFLVTHVPLMHKALIGRPFAHSCRSRLDIRGLHVTEFWRRAIERGAPTNLVVRKDAFWSVGGFPVANRADLFREPGLGEDIGFASSLGQLMEELGGTQVSADIVTVKYFRRPGNSLDRQAGKFGVD